MIDRYTDSRIEDIWSDENKFRLWQMVELAYIDAQIANGDIKTDESIDIHEALLKAPINIERIREIEKKTRHDLNAFVQERREHLPTELQSLFHRGNTSYDTEEPAMALMLGDSYIVVTQELDKLQLALMELSETYRFTPMIARTHGQEAELQSFGKRWRSYLRDLLVSASFLKTAAENLQYSKFSGAVGNYTTITPILESETLEDLGLKPYVGATQIVPREVYAPLAFALAQTCQTIHKIALGIRLAGRSGRPFCQEPFGKGQMGSSAMPHKKNTIITEQLEGMARMALDYANMLVKNIPTWEERSIEQSCVERVAWPDLFHVVVHSLKRLTTVLKGLVVYPENMLAEIVESGGLYASNEAKELLKAIGHSYDLTAEEAYRIVQLAAFNVADIRRQLLKREIPGNLKAVDKLLEDPVPSDSITAPVFKALIENADLRTSNQLNSNEETVKHWNEILKEIFNLPENVESWRRIFLPSHLLLHEDRIFKSISPHLFNLETRK